MDDVIIGYMCKTTFEEELRYSAGGSTIFADAKDLQNYGGCSPQCGVVEVEVRLRRVVSEPAE
jgi:hypothetical protein